MLTPEMKMRMKVAYLREFAAGVDPMGFYSGQYGQEAEREGASQGKLMAHRGLGAAGGIVGSGLLLPSVISGTVEGAAGMAAGKGMRDRLARGGRGFVLGFKKPVKGLHDAAVATKFLGRAAKSGGKATNKEMRALRSVAKEAPIGAVDKDLLAAIDRAKGYQGPMGELGSELRKVRDLEDVKRGLKSTGRSALDLDVEGAKKNLRTTKEDAKAMYNQSHRGAELRAAGKELEGASGEMGTASDKARSVLTDQGDNLELDAETAKRLHGTAKNQLARFGAGLGLGGLVGGAGAVAQYEKGRAAQQRMKTASVHEERTGGMFDALVKTARTYVSSFGDGGGGFGGRMPSMPAPSVAGGFGGAKFVGFTGGGGGGRFVGSDAGSALVARHQGAMAAQNMMYQNEFNKSYANALGRMASGR